jgi:hypothetical protein
MTFHQSGTARMLKSLGHVLVEPGFLGVLQLRIQGIMVEWWQLNQERRGLADEINGRCRKQDNSICERRSSLVFFGLGGDLRQERRTE